MDELKGLEQLVGKPEEKARVRRALAIAQRGEGEINTYRATLMSAPRDLAAMRDLRVPIVALSNRLREATEQVSGLIGIAGGAVASTGHDRQEPQDIAVAAERLAAETQRLSSMTLAVGKAIAQSRLIKLPTPPPPPPPQIQVIEQSPREKLMAFANQYALFFSNGTDYLKPGESAAVLDKLAELMRGNTILVRVVGYTDEKGGASRNSPLSQSRAERVRAELIGKGVAANRLVAIGRVDGANLSLAVGSDSPNRRVQFEIGFEGEAKVGSRTSNRLEGGRQAVGPL